MKDESPDQLYSVNSDSAIAESEALDPTIFDSSVHNHTVLDQSVLESAVPDSGITDSPRGSKPQIVPRPLSNFSPGKHVKGRFIPFDISFPRTYGFSGGFSGRGPAGHQTREHSRKPELGRSAGSVWEDLQLSPPRASRRPTILLIEPDGEKTQQLSVKLTVDGYLPVVVSDQYEALRMARLLSVDLVICSLSIVGRDGDYFVRHFRKTPNHADVPVILLTDRTLEDEDAFLKFGADALCVEEEAENSVLALAAFYLGA